MNTDEYNQSLERELRLRQQGKKRAAEIERKWRNEWLRGGGYDSYDGGKQFTTKALRSDNVILILLMSICEHFQIFNYYNI